MSHQQRRTVRRTHGWRGTEARRLASPWNGSPRTIHLRSWPGRARWRQPDWDATRISSSLRDRAGLVIHACSDRAALDRFALLAAIETAGISVVRRMIVVPDDLETQDPEAVARVVRWAASHRRSTTLGPSPWEVMTLSVFFEHREGPFARVAYSGAGFVVGADLLRSLGLCAEHASALRGDDRYGRWELWFPTWGRRGAKSNWHRRSPHRPALWAWSRRVGSAFRFGPVESGNGKAREELERGGFLDVMSLSYALDAARGASFGGHSREFGLVVSELPLAVTFDEAGCDSLAGAAEAVRLAFVLDDEASRWFPDDRPPAWRGGIDRCRTASPGALASETLRRLGVASPLSQFDLTDDELQAWIETLHGGWCSLDRRLVDVPFVCVSCDISSAFPAVAVLLGWWEVIRAERLDREDVLTELRELCERAIVDPSVVADRAIWRRFGLTLCRVHPEGEPFAIELDDPRRPEGRFEVVPVSSPTRRFWVTWPDVVAAAIRSGRVPTLLSATRLVPIGRPFGLAEQLVVRDDVAIEEGSDPAVALVIARQRAKDAKDERLAALLRVVANALVFGVFCRFDPAWDRGQRSERPGPWSFVPLAASVTAGARLLLALFDRLVTDRGCLVAYRDTDSSIVPAFPSGGELVLSDGSRAQTLSWAEVGEVTAAFNPLCVFGRDVPFWKVSRGTAERPLNSLVYAPKRHAEFVFQPDGDRNTFELVDWSEANLGAAYCNPPRSGQWSKAAVEREVALSLDRAEGRNSQRPAAVWDAAGSVPFPALRRRAVVSPAVLASLPETLRARPGSRFIEVASDPALPSTFSPVALDPGGNLADWCSLCFRDRETGQPVEVSVDPIYVATTGAFLAGTLDGVAAGWSHPPRGEVIERVDVDSDHIVYVGAASPVIDAELVGEPGDLPAMRMIGPASTLPRARPPRRTSIRLCARYGCDAALDGRPDARYCSKACREAGRRARLRSGS